MDKNDNAQAPASTGESSAPDVETPATSGTATAATALGNPGFLQNIQQQFDATAEDGSLFVGRYDTIGFHYTFI